MKQKLKFPKLLNYQIDILNFINTPEVKFVTFLKSRQSGGSWFNKWILSFWALQSKNEKIGFVTPTTKLSKLFFKELCISFEPYIKIANKSDLYIEFITGSNCQFFSAESEDSIRGFQFTRLIIDEAAFMKPDLFDNILRPTVLIQGKTVVLCSTPNFADGFFHQHYQLGNDTSYPAYRSKRITIYDNPFVNSDEIDTIKQTIPDRIFRKEYLSEFIDGDGAVFSNYKNCIGTGRLTGKYFAAIDWAKQNDYTVVTIINDLKEVVKIHRFTGVDYTVQVKMVIEILNKWKPIVTLSEENNIGQVINELLKDQYKGKIKQVTLDNSFKRKMIEGLIVAFETKGIVIPDDQDLLNELSYFTCIYNTQTQSVKYTAPNGLHDDMVISLAYAYYLTTQKQVTTVIR